MSTSQRKQCGLCGQSYAVREILERPEFRPLGLQPAPPGSALHGLYFQHTDAHCGSLFFLPLTALEPFLDRAHAPIGPDPELTCDVACQNLEKAEPCRVEDCVFSPYLALLRKYHKLGLVSANSLAQS
jgi:hypothetical protein